MSDSEEILPDVEEIATISLKRNIDISRYTQLTAFLRKKSEGTSSRTQAFQRKNHLKSS